jgi:DNA-binding protein HU-beta
MTKAELVERIYAMKEFRGAVSKKLVGALLDAMFEEIGRSIRKEGKFSYPDFGTFSRRKKAARVGRNPKTQEKIKIPAHQTVAFKVHKAFKESLNPRGR